MTEAGEGTARAEPVETEKKGDLEVEVVDICDSNPVEKAEVRVAGESKTTDANGIAEFTGLSLGSAQVGVKLHDEAMDYSTFIVHYPRVLRSHAAKTRADGEAEIKIGDKPNTVKAGEIMLMPGGISHWVQAKKRFKMLLTLFKVDVT